jgi:hypothetical protein
MQFFPYLPFTLDNSYFGLVNHCFKIAPDLTYCSSPVLSNMQTVYTELYVCMYGITYLHKLGSVIINKGTGSSVKIGNMYLV